MLTLRIRRMYDGILVFEFFDYPANKSLGPVRGIVDGDELIGALGCHITCAL